ncbi:MAG: TraB/GumN family protein [Caulobacter sp. 12-67-6]|nr:MAG: TraB/GumN family protein [Caulobacter sp. 12-67-6]OYX70827.1 MAG: TraB/GumN family protein [Caulobacter sp. 32-67-35]
MRTLAAALALLASSPIAAYAQIPEDPEANLVEELVVNARLPGPAWWRISDADTTIYVLGTLASLPKGAAWDRSVLERRLDGAFALILPPVGRAGITDIPAMLRLRGKLKSDQPLDAAAPELAPRLAKVRAQLGKKPDAYREWSPLGAGIMIAMDYQKTNRLDPGEPERAVGKLARKHRVKARPAGTYKAMPVVKAAVRDHSAEAGRLCLEGVLSEAEAGGAAARSAAQAWARGDVREAIAGPRNFQRCIRSLPGMVELEKRAMDDEIAALTEAMKTPGHAVALFSIRGLVAQNGLLDRMRAKGFTVKTPGD